jgi:hypothetical protein
VKLCGIQRKKLVMSKKRSSRFQEGKMGLVAAGYSPDGEVVDGPLFIFDFTSVCKNLLKRPKLKVDIIILNYRFSH